MPNTVQGTIHKEALKPLAPEYCPCPYGDLISYNHPWQNHSTRFDHNMLTDYDILVRHVGEVVNSRRLRNPCVERLPIKAWVLYQLMMQIVERAARVAAHANSVMRRQVHRERRQRYNT
jgi:hypothetical protein